MATTRDLAARLAGFDARLPGSDAERRAARALEAELTQAGQDVRLEPFWCRPNWALAHCWHLALGLAGSLVAVGSAPVGAAMVLVALVSVIFDAQLGLSPGRRLTPERASQNVIATRRAPTSAASVPRAKPVRLIITANYDVGRVGVVYARRPRSAAGWFARRTGGISPGWLGWTAIALAWLLVTAVLRVEGDRGTVIGTVQLPPTVAVVIALAALLELGTGGATPGAGDNGSGVAVAVALAKALAVAPPGHADVELVLQGAGDAASIGLRRYLRPRRELTARTAVIVGIGACGRGQPAWWQSDGSFVPLRTARPLRQLSAQVAADEPHLGARPHRSRGLSPVYPALQRRVPAITIGCVDGRGLVPDSHRPTDTPDRLSAESIDAATHFGLLLADAIDAHLARRTPSEPTATRA